MAAIGFFCTSAKSGALPWSRTNVWNLEASGERVSESKTFHGNRQLPSSKQVQQTCVASSDNLHVSRNSAPRQRDQGGRQAGRQGSGHHIISGAANSQGCVDITTKVLIHIEPLVAREEDEQEVKGEEGRGRYGVAG
jgi:hypothetical protein